MRAQCVPAVVLSMLLSGQSGAQEPGRIAGRDYAERSQALIAYLAKASPRFPDFPKEAMPLLRRTFTDGNRRARHVASRREDDRRGLAGIAPGSV